MKGYRQEGLWFAYFVHRVSGIVLALFLPVHFYVLSLALTDRESLDGILHFGELPVARLGLVTLVLLLAVHLFGGLRLLVNEFGPWTSRQKTLAAASGAAGFLVACLFLARAM